jgi:hypothetical protein
MDGVIAGAEPDGSDRKVLYRAGVPANRYRVTSMYGILHQQKIPMMRSCTNFCDSKRSATPKMLAPRATVRY